MLRLLHGIRRIMLYRIPAWMWMMPWVGMHRLHILTSMIDIRRLIVSHWRRLLLIRILRAVVAYWSCWMRLMMVWMALLRYWRDMRGRIAHCLRRASRPR